MNNIKYDPKVDAAYLMLSDEKYVESEEISEGVILDYDENNNVIAVELLGVATLQIEEWKKLQPRLPEAMFRQLQEFLMNFAKPISV